MKFLRALRNLSQGLQQEIADSKLIGHRGERGRFREFAVRRLLRPHLPNACGIGTGEVFDLAGNSSKQMDIVLYDELFGNVLFRNQELCLFPCETVYGALEVKSHLNSNELKNAIENSKSLKNLVREDSTGCDITPFYELKFGPGLAGPEEKSNFYFHGILALSSIDPKEISKCLSLQIHKCGIILPDFIWIFDPGTFIFAARNSNQNVVPAALGGERQLYTSIQTSSDTIPIMLLTINTLLGQIRLKAPNYNNYWIQVLDDAIKEQS